MASSESVNVSGLRVAYVRRGEGDPLMLLHGGFGLDHRSWEPQLEALADEFDVIAWDAPGTGESSDPPPEFRMPDYADCLAGFLAAIGVDRAHVLGLSFGGSLALELYRRHERVPRSLLIAGGYAGWKGSLPAEVVQQRLDSYVTEMHRPPSEWLPGYLPGMFGSVASQATKDHLLSLMLDIRPDGVEAELRSMAECDLRDVLPRVRVPTLLLWGDADARAALSIGEEFHNQISDSKLCVFPGVGHVSNLEVPDAFNQEVRAFLHSVDA